MPKPQAPGAARGLTAAQRYAIAGCGALALFVITNRLVTPFHGVLFTIPTAGTAVAALALGVGPALLLSLVAGLGLWYGVLEPRGSFTVARTDDADHVIAYFVTCIIVVVAIHHLRQARGELEVANARLREADQRKDDFLATLSHELRNLLAPILNSVFVLGKSPAAAPRERRAQQVIERQVGHMARLVEELLDVSRIARGKTSLQRERVDLGRLVRRTAEDFRSVFVQNGVQLEVVVADRALVVDGDPTRLAQVVGNLLQNAAKFTPRGGQTRVSVAEATPGRVRLSVHDDGPEIPAALRPSLFEAFTQGEPRGRANAGLGLGLALVKGFVELHGGEVTAAGGPGAEIVVELPLANTEPTTHPAPAAPAGPARGRRVLVIDDNRDEAESLKDALELEGHAVEIAFDGLSGIERARQFGPEVVLCDIGLPGIDGYETARRMRADPSLRQAHLFALSGYTQPEDREQALLAGFEDHLSKPPALDALGERLRQLSDG